MKKHLARVPNVARVPIEREALEKAERSLTVSTNKLELSDEVLQLWLRWCRRYCVSGVVVAPDGCPVPVAEVTVYTVGLDGSGFTKQARATVTTDMTGHFTACFCWCTGPYCCSCWPCAPFWWLCWPWWWERDMLHILETLEKVPAGSQSPFGGLQSGAVLMRPEGRALIKDQGFPAAGQAKPDAARNCAPPAQASSTRALQRKSSLAGGGAATIPTSSSALPRPALPLSTRTRRPRRAGACRPGAASLWSPARALSRPVPRLLHRRTALCGPASATPPWTPSTAATPTASLAPMPAISLSRVPSTFTAGSPWELPFTTR